MGWIEHMHKEFIEKDKILLIKTEERVFSAEKDKNKTWVQIATKKVETGRV